jgi:ABC-2 type transport system ATP-binding protein
MAAPESIIEIKDLVKGFGDLAAFDGISLSIKNWGVFGFLGADCAGKTTIMVKRNRV